MLGMTREQIDQAVDEWYLNNQDQVSSFIQGFGAASDCGDDVMELVTKVMASIGTTVALSAIKDILTKNNEIITAQIDELIAVKVAEALQQAGSQS